LVIESETQHTQAIGSKVKVAKFIVCLLLPTQVTISFAETGYDAWLRYQPLEQQVRLVYASLPKLLVLVGGLAGAQLGSR
jgi:hypothetical protein